VAGVDIHGKRAIVTGASSGIGEATVAQLRAAGVRVAGGARRADAIDADVALELDVTDPASCAAFVERALEELGGVDILVNNDGAPPLGDILSFDDAAWAKAVDQNLMYVVRMVREAVPVMKARGGGSILNITAISAIQPIPGFALSVATWAGVIGFAKTLSLEVAAHGINVNTICPGYIDTTRLQKVFAAGTEAADVVRERLVQEIPMQRIGTVDDIASVVALLVSPVALAASRPGYQNVPNAQGEAGFPGAGSYMGTKATIGL